MDEKSVGLTVGSTVKSGQVLALVGDLRGISVNIDIPEIDLDKVTMGMPALVRGVAFANETLKGKLITINAQASNSSNGALPSFTAVVVVPHLTTAQQALIKVGMSAAIDLLVQSPKKLYVPIRAVHSGLGHSIVMVKTKDGNIHKTPVITGEARSDKVAIESGLQAGDVVLYDAAE
jgi:multidrug efflux pump subunit AcrA (membrane-fusion protein)